MRSQLVCRTFLSYLTVPQEHSQSWSEESSRLKKEWAVFTGLSDLPIIIFRTILHSSTVRLLSLCGMNKGYLDFQYQHTTLLPAMAARLAGANHTRCHSVPCHGQSPFVHSWRNTCNASTCPSRVARVMPNDFVAVLLAVTGGTEHGGQQMEHIGPSEATW